jgi:lysyl-tRNA synthetase class I|tara:strand:+ start:2956 stop:3150 length:195 start_codon:yes stop_codon:yes gene_type:complete
MAYIHGLGDAQERYAQEDEHNGPKMDCTECGQVMDITNTEHEDYLITIHFECDCGHEDEDYIDC